MNGRVVIVNADDFGQTSGINRGIIESFANGIVTSASFMVRGAAAVDAAEFAQSHPGLSVGLHIDLGEWTYQNGEWRVRYQFVPFDDRHAVHEEANKQLLAFRELVGRDPTHLDSHQHVHQSKPLREWALKAAREMKIPLRHQEPDILYCGSFYGRTNDGESLPDSISATALADVLRGLRPGITEVACHPGYASDVESDYRDERLIEVRSLCDPSVKQVLQSEGIRLASFSSPEVVFRRNS